MSVTGLAAATGSAHPSATATTTALAAGHAAVPADLPKLGADHVTYVMADDPRARAAAASYNRRTELTPGVRAICRTPKAVSEVLRWARAQGVPFSVRSGGHCFEGFSQSRDLVLDVRGLSRVAVGSADEMLSVGAGSVLAHINRATSVHDLALPAGWCQSVGIAGHALGGGIGFLSRAGGLACDALESIDVIDAQGRQLTASATENEDLYWASRGGGGGSFGIATAFRFKLMRIGKVVRFATQLRVPPPPPRLAQ
ncbi:MAG: FAD-binding oxidoreductase [Pseudomonadota bacterium]